MKRAIHLILVCMLGGVFHGCGSDREERARKISDQYQKAQIHYADHEFTQALALARDALAMSMEFRDDSVTADCYFLLATCQRQLGLYDSALQSFQSAVQHFRSVSEQHLERRARIALAEFYQLLGNHEDAISIAASAAAAAKVFSRYDDAHRAYAIIAQANHDLERYGRELDAVAEMIENDHQRANGKQVNPGFLKMRSQAFMASGETAKARGAFDEWVDAARLGGDSNAVAEAYYTWGSYLERQGKHDDALRYYTRAAGIVDQRKNDKLPIALLTALGNLAYRSQQFTGARGYYSDALQLARRMRVISTEQILQLALAASEAKLSAGNRVDSTLLRRVLTVGETCRQYAYRLGEAFSYFIIGVWMERAGDPSNALAYYRLAMNLYEETVNGETEVHAPFIATFFETERTGWFDGLIQAYCTTGNVDSAFVTVEKKNLDDIRRYFSRMSLRASNGRLTNQLSSIRWQYSTARLLERDIHEELSNPNRKLFNRLEALAALYPLKRASLTASLEQLGSISPAMNWLLGSVQLTLRQVQEVLPENALLLEFAPLGNSIYTLVVRRSSASVVKGSVNRQYLVPLVEEHNRLMSEVQVTSMGMRVGDPTSLQRISALSSVLSNVLLGPVASDIRAAAKVYIVPPVEFGWFPFHTLRLDGSPLVERVNVSYLPSAAVLLFPEPRARLVGSVIGLGHPGTTGWDVEYELKDIRGFYEGTSLLFDTSATFRHLADSSFDLLSLAVEYHLNRQVPDNSGFTMPDGITPFGLRSVPLTEALTAPIPYVLLMSNLSALPGQFYRYAPMLFLAAGTRTVIATQWQGDRRAKRAFGEGFYTSLSIGATASEAYIRGVTGMTRREEFSHPQRWGMYYQFGR